MTKITTHPPLNSRENPTEATIALPIRQHCPSDQSSSSSTSNDDDGLNLGTDIEKPTYNTIKIVTNAQRKQYPLSIALSPAKSHLSSRDEMTGTSPRTIAPSQNNTITCTQESLR